MNKWEPMRGFSDQKYWLSTHIGEEYYLKTKEFCGKHGEKDYKIPSSLHYGEGNGHSEHYVYMNIKGTEPQISVDKEGYFNVLSYEEMKPEEYDLILVKFKQLLEEKKEELQVTELKCEV